MSRALRQPTPDRHSAIPAFRHGSVVLSPGEDHGALSGEMIGDLPASNPFCSPRSGFQVRGPPLPLVTGNFPRSGSSGACNCLPPQRSFSWLFAVATPTLCVGPNWGVRTPCPFGRIGSGLSPDAAAFGHVCPSGRFKPAEVRLSFAGLSNPSRYRAGRSCSVPSARETGSKDQISQSALRHMAASGVAIGQNKSARRFPVGAVSKPDLVWRICCKGVTLSSAFFLSLFQWLIIV